MDETGWHGQAYSHARDCGLRRQQHGHLSTAAHATHEGAVGCALAHQQETSQLGVLKHTLRPPHRFPALAPIPNEAVQSPRK